MHSYNTVPLDLIYQYFKYSLYLSITLVLQFILSSLYHRYPFICTFTSPPPLPITPFLYYTNNLTHISSTLLISSNSRSSSLLHHPDHQLSSPTPLLHGTSKPHSSPPPFTHHPLYPHPLNEQAPQKFAASTFLDGFTLAFCILRCGLWIVGISMWAAPTWIGGRLHRCLDLIRALQL